MSDIITDRYHLHNGDCLEFMKTLDNGAVDFVFTDPPYGHNNNNGDLIHKREKALGKNKSGSHEESRPIMNDGEEADDLYRSFLSDVPRLIKPGCCCCCCCCGGGPDPQFAKWSLWMNEHLSFKQMIVWDKGPMGMGWHYRRSYETVLVGEKPGAKCKWYDDTNTIENIIRPSQYGIRKIIPSKDQHPTQKPWQLAAHFIGLHTQPGDVVFDPFMGSGQTAIAALALGRRFVGVELDEYWYSVAAKRIADAAAQPPLFTLDSNEEKSAQLGLFDGLDE